MSLVKMAKKWPVMMSREAMWMTVNNEDDVNDVTILAMRRVWKLGARILWVMAAVSRR